MSEDALDPVAELLTSLRIERGHPEPEELAALTVVLTQWSRQAPVEPLPAPRSRWNDRCHLLGLSPTPGPGSWRASALPH
ncbi:MAG: acyl-CoA carboxylase subunit epsilon [Janthinobacterium lividum]